MEAERIEEKSEGHSRPILKSDHEAGTIQIDAALQLVGIPSSSWEYKLGNRSALDWILDQYREKTPKDPAVREKFHHYNFSRYETDIVKLLMRVTRVSVETAKILDAMRGNPR